MMNAFRSILLASCAFLALSSLPCGQGCAQETDVPTTGEIQSMDSATPVIHWNMPLRTLGGKQFWTDLVHFHGYRIQKNAVSGHHRLLAPSNTRVAWGNMAGCKQELDRITTEKKLSPVTGRVVIVLHGLSRARSSMQPISDYLKSETGAQVINLSYASGRSGIEEHAAALDSVIRHLPDAREIDFVAHSMGNIIVRYYLATHGHDKRFRRMVMLAPPNHGSQLANWLEKNLIFKTVTGDSGQQLAGQWIDIAGKLATPQFDFAIIAGSPGEDGGVANPLIDGENDLVVSVAETKLAGATDFWQGDLWHSTMMYDSDVQKAVYSYLENGYLISEEKRQPITDDQSTAPPPVDEGR